MYVTYARERRASGRLNDDREGAILAYHRYLLLRSEAEPRLRPQLAQVRADLEALEPEKPRTDEVRGDPPWQSCSWLGP